MDLLPLARKLNSSLLTAETWFLTPSCIKYFLQKRFIEEEVQKTCQPFNRLIVQVARLERSENGWSLFHEQDWND